jgi:hypothetical protein
MRAVEPPAPSAPEPASPEPASPPSPPSPSEPNEAIVNELGYGIPTISSADREWAAYRFDHVRDVWNDLEFDDEEDAVALVMEIERRVLNACLRSTWYLRRAYRLFSTNNDNNST